MEIWHVVVIFLIGAIVGMVLQDTLFGSKVELDCQPDDLERIKAARSATVSIEEELHV